MEYQDLEITFSLETAANYTVTVKSQSGHRTTDSFQIPPQLMWDADRLNPEVFARAARRNIVVDEYEDEDEDEGPAGLKLSEREVGYLLFQKLFAGNTGRLGKILQEMKPAAVRLILVIPQSHDPTQLKRLALIHALPWEQLHDGETFMTMNRLYSVVRMVDGQAPPPRKCPRKARVLVIAANPEHRMLEKLHLQAEQGILAQANKRGHLKMKFLGKGMQGHLQRELENG